MCSSHVAVTLALSATAEEAGGRPKEASGRDAPSSRGLCSPARWSCRRTEHLPTSPRRPTLTWPSPSPANSLPRNSVHILFWSVGDLFTYRSSFCFPQTLFCRHGVGGVCVRCVPGSWPSSPGGEGGMPGVCLSIYHSLVRVRLLEGKRTLKKNVLSELAHSVPWWSLSLDLRSLAT